jgi:hypothetical protein
MVTYVSNLMGVPTIFKLGENIELLYVIISENILYPILLNMRKIKTPICGIINIFSICDNIN